jgi:O-glycosyl hydrolase
MVTSLRHAYNNGEQGQNCLRLAVQDNRFILPKGDNYEFDDKHQSRDKVSRQHAGSIG